MQQYESRWYCTKVAPVQWYELMLSVKNKTTHWPWHMQIVSKCQIEFLIRQCWESVFFKVSYATWVCFLKSHMQHAFWTPCWHCKLDNRSRQMPYFSMVFGKNQIKVTALRSQNKNSPTGILTSRQTGSTKFLAPGHHLLHAWLQFFRNYLWQT